MEFYEVYKFFQIRNYADETLVFKHLKLNQVPTISMFQQSAHSSNAINFCCEPSYPD